MKKAALLLNLLLIAAALAQAATQGKLSVYGQPSINVDPLCNPDNSATGFIKIQNEGPAGTPAVPLYLTATSLSMKSPARTLPAKINLTVDKKFLPANQDLWIKLEVFGVDEAGQWETTIQNQYVDIGTVKIVRTEAPFHLTLDTADQAAPELTFLRNKPASFGLKNDDDKDYLVTWEYTLNGQTVRSSDPSSRQGCRALESGSQSSAESQSVSSFASAFNSSGASAAVHQTETSPGAIVVPAQGFKAAAFCPPRRWFGSGTARFTALFKDQTGDGRLVIKRSDRFGCTLTKTFNIKTHLAGSTGTKREAIADFWILVFLFMGGIASVVLNFTIPNRQRRVELKRRLGDLGARISNLSVRLASRVRVLAGLEVNLLRQKLKDASGFNTDFEAEMQDIDQAVKRLDTRIQLSEQVDDIRDNFEQLRSKQALAPSQIEEIEEKFDSVIEILKKAVLVESDMQAASVLIADLQKQVGPADRKDETLKAELARRIQALKDDFERFEKGNVGNSEAWKRVTTELCGPLDLINAANPDDIHPQDYDKLQTAAFKTEIARDYVLLVEGICVPDDEVRKRIREHEPKLFDLLKSDGEALLLAVSLLSQMREGVFPEDLAHALEYPQARIQIQRFEIRQYEPCGFKLEFLDAKLNCATARESWVGQWKFRHAGEPDLTEEGWEVTHYFQRADIYEFHVKLISRTDGRIIDINDPNFKEKPVPRTPKASWFGRIVNWLRARRYEPLPEEPGALYLEVLPKKKRRYDTFVVETLRFLLAMFIVLLGMLAGAKDQLLKLDVIPALIAIFLLGFNADAVKKLLSNSKSGTSSSA